ARRAEQKFCLSDDGNALSRQWRIEKSPPHLNWRPPYDTARNIRVNHEERRRHFYNGSRDCGADRSRSARKSAGTSASSTNAKKSAHPPGFRDRITSPVTGSPRMKTSFPSKR